MTRTTSRQNRTGELARRLHWHIASSPRRGDECAVLVLHVLEHARRELEARALPLLHASLADRVRLVVRHTDIVEASEGGVGVVLWDAGYDGARAAFERLYDALAPVSADVEPTSLVAMGYVSGTRECLDEVDAERALISAWQARRVVSVHLTVPVEPPHKEHILASATRKPRVSRASHSSSIRQKVGESKPVLVASKVRDRTISPAPYRASAAPDSLREQALALGVPYVDLPPRLSAACRRALAPKLALELRAVPIGRTRGTLTVAMHNPRDDEAVQRLGIETGLVIFPVLASPDALDRALSQFASHH